MNGVEEGVDCGGTCGTVCPACDDNIKNGDEDGVDCGGTCPTACIPDNTGGKARRLGLSVTSNKNPDRRGASRAATQQQGGGSGPTTIIEESDPDEVCSTICITSVPMCSALLAPSALPVLRS